MPELRGSVPGAQPCVQVFPARPEADRGTELATAQGAHGNWRQERRAIPLLRSTTGLCRRSRRAFAAAARSTGRKRLSGALHSVWRVHEGVPQQCPAAGVTEAGLEGSLDAGRGAAHRLLRTQLRAVLAGVSYGRHLGDHGERKRLGGRRGPRNDAKPIRLGTAFYDRGRCLPWAMATDCIVCEEWCPTSPKAIYVQEAEVIDASGKTKILKQPRVNPERCVGCGACEHACVLQDRAAIQVTSVGESRSRDNQILLNRIKERPRT